MAGSAARRAMAAAMAVAVVLLGSCLCACCEGQTQPVELTDDAETVTLANGIVSGVFDKATAGMVSLRKGERELMGNGGATYFQMVADGAYSSPQNATAEIVASTPEMVDVSFTRDEPGYPFLTEVHYVLRRGESGFHTYVVFEYDPKRTETAQMEQMNWAFRLDPAIFRFAHVDEERQVELPTPEDLRNGETLRPREATRLEDGRIDDKYALSAMMGEHLVHGLTGTSVGAWVIQPSREDINGGPTNQELTLHQTHTTPVVLRMAQAGHYGSGRLDFDARDGVWRKLYGPWLLYVNEGDDREWLWMDAKEKADREADAWPYQWLDHALYPIDRGVVAGRLVMGDGKPASGARVLLAAPEGGRTPNWQRQGKGFQFWAKADGKGRFRIAKVRPGDYSLYAFVAGTPGELRVDGVSVEAGRKTDLGTLEWQPRTRGKTLWQIGTADRTAAEYLGGDRFREWGTHLEFSALFPTGVDFRIGESREDRDWFYQHCTVEVEDGQWLPVPWRVRFDLSEPMSGKAALTVGIASATTAGLRLVVNGTEIAYWPELITCGANCRNGIQGYSREKAAVFDAGLLKVGENVLVLEQTRRGEFSGVMYDCVRLEVEAP